MSKEVKRFYIMPGSVPVLLSGDPACTPMTNHLTDVHTVPLVLASDYDALLAERDALKAELALWAQIHYEVHRRAEKEWCLSSGCDFTVTVMHDDYAAIDAALQGAQP